MGRGAAGLFGIVRSVGKNGVSLETRARGRNDDAKTVDVAFDAKTVILFSGVDKDGAKIAEGMAAMVQLVDGTKNNTAGVITFNPVEGRGFRRDKRPDIMGRIVSGDEKSLTLEQFAGRGEEPTKVTVKLGEKAGVTYFNVVAGAAKPAEGMQAQIWLEEGSKDTATQVMLHAQPAERWATISGKLMASTADTITIEQPPTMRGEEPKQTTVKISTETKVSYRNVGPNEAKPTTGYYVQARLLDGSKDTAAEATFTKPGDGDRRR
jgi:hypothetical protein